MRKRRTFCEPSNRNCDAPAVATPCGWKWRSDAGGRHDRTRGLIIASRGAHSSVTQAARVIDSETRSIIERIYDRVRDLVTTKKRVLMDAAAELKLKETLEGDRLRQLLAGDPVEGTR